MTAIAEELRQEVAGLQHAFWDLLGELEEELGVEIDSSRDLHNVTCEELIESSE